MIAIRDSEFGRSPVNRNGTDPVLPNVTTAFNGGPTMGMSRSARFLIAIPAAMVALLLPLAGQAAAAVPLPAAESPHTTFGGHFCDYADIEQGYGTLNEAGEDRVYQTAYRETDESGLQQAVLYVFENDASWFKKQMGSWNKGRLLGEVVIGCGTGGW
jgi:hypothetical protein